LRGKVGFGGEKKNGRHNRQVWERGEGKQLLSRRLGRNGAGGRDHAKKKRRLFPLPFAGEGRERTKPLLAGGRKLREGEGISVSAVEEKEEDRAQLIPSSTRQKAPFERKKKSPSNPFHQFASPGKRERPGKKNGTRFAEEKETWSGRKRTEHHLKRPSESWGGEKRPPIPQRGRDPRGKEEKAISFFLIYISIRKGWRNLFVSARGGKKGVLGKKREGGPGSLGILVQTWAGKKEGA